MDIKVVVRRIRHDLGQLVVGNIDAHLILEPVWRLKNFYNHHIEERPRTIIVNVRRHGPVEPGTLRQRESNFVSILIDPGPRPPLPSKARVNWSDEVSTGLSCLIARKRTNPINVRRAAELVSAAKLRHSALKRIGATDSDEVALPTYETDEG